MTKNAQRLSQLISTFGPGAMIDLPTRSVVVGGLEQWDMKGDAFTTIPEPRLTMRLEQLLKDQGRLDQGARLSLRTPPVSADRNSGIPRGVAAPVFPTWFVCEQVETITSGARTVRRRRLVRWQDLDTKGRRRFIFDDGRKTDVTPIRFVCACEKGHLQDIEWRWAVHGAAQCQEPMWIEETRHKRRSGRHEYCLRLRRPPLAAGYVPAWTAREMPRRSAMAAGQRPRWLRR